MIVRVPGDLRKETELTMQKNIRLKGGPWAVSRTAAFEMRLMYECGTPWMFLRRIT